MSTVEPGGKRARSSFTRRRRSASASAPSAARRGGLDQRLARGALADEIDQVAGVARVILRGLCPSVPQPLLRNPDAEHLHRMGVLFEHVDVRRAAARNGPRCSHAVDHPRLHLVEELRPGSAPFPAAALASPVTPPGSSTPRLTTQSILTSRYL